MIILFSNCGFAIIAFLFYLCGSNRVAEVFADFIVNNCYLIFAVLLIITFLISFYLVRKNSFKSVKVTATIGFTILDFAKVLIFYLLLVTWSIDFVCHNDVLNSIISLLVIPLDLMLMYGKEASNRKQEIDRQHHTIPNQRANDKHHGNVYNLLFRYGKVRSQNMEKLKSSFPTFCKRTFPQLHKIASYAHYAQCRLLRKPSHFIIYSRK